MWNPFKKKEEPKQAEQIDDQLLKIRKQLEEATSYNHKINSDEYKDHNAIKESGIVNRTKERLWPERTYLINMELRNGMHKTFMVSTKENYFKFMGGVYVIDQQLSYFNVSSKTYCLDYHQDIPIGIKREVPVKDIQKTIKELSKIDADQLVTAMNPLSLEAFMEGRVIEQLMKAQEIDAFFKNMRIIFIIILCVSIAHFLLFMKAAGMFSSIKIPGMG